ncbi:MAG: response regulator [Devosia sp.]|uniref:response regulator n=1 Tax=Devosia sp. TaxID=1871048 RepID=UPI001A01CAD1|nr:response regulator [Devosia sp.]MBF0679914.1 response regulator [Devosia sp.]
MRTKILVVQDEFFIAMRVQEILADAGYEVLGPVASVVEAQQTLSNERPDACILDFHLRDGFADELAPHLTRLSIPFVLSSSYEIEALTAEPTFRKAPNIGKPALEAELISALNRVLIPRS